MDPCLRTNLINHSSLFGWLPEQHSPTAVKRARCGGSGKAESGGRGDVRRQPRGAAFNIAWLMDDTTEHALASDTAPTGRTAAIAAERRSGERVA